MEKGSAQHDLLSEKQTWTFSPSCGRIACRAARMPLLGAFQQG
jgi:hypothetical protein